MLKTCALTKCLAVEKTRARLDGRTGSEVAIIAAWFFFPQLEVKHLQSAVGGVQQR